MTKEHASRVDAAAETLAKIMDMPEKSIPSMLLENAKGIAIIPGVIKVGLMVGGQFGRGVLVTRRQDGGWSDPAFITLMSGSIGWQVGAESTDFVLVFKTARSVEGILRGKYTLGADVSVAAGPVGRTASAATDIGLNAEIYSYSRSRGAFAGWSLEGSSLQIDREAAQAFYGRSFADFAEIPEPAEPQALAALKRLRKELNRHARKAA